MNISNLMTESLINALMAGIAVDKVLGTFEKRICDMADAGWTPEKLDENKPAVMAVAADRILSKAELALFNDEGKAQQMKGPDGKQVKTPRGRLVNRVHSSVRRIREGLVTLAAVESGTENRGTRDKKSPVEQLRAACELALKRIATDRKRDDKALKGHDELKTAFQKALDLLK